jgi:ribulose-5-phosphate 4-epimerase/fuculose-1-phosphate aldolase
MHFMGNIVYHEFGGFEFDMRQRAPLIRDLGDKKIALLRNHGSLVCGATIGGAMVAHNQLEVACQGQIAALSAGEDQVVLVSPEAQTYAGEQVRNLNAGRDDGGKDWKGMLRMADRMFPDYRN